MKQLKLSEYFLIYIALSVAIFIAFSSFIMAKLDSLDASFSDSNLKAATLELSDAIINTEQRIKKLASEISDWDEVHQQLTNPDYYLYWKAQRLGSSQLPVFIVSIDVYDTNKEVLKTSDDVHLPEVFKEESVYYSYEDETIYYIHFLPVHSRNKLSKTIGYVGVKANFTAAMLELNRFTFVDVNSLSFVSSINDSRYEEIYNNFNFKAAENPVYTEIYKVVYGSLQQSALLVLLFMLLLYFLVKSIVSNPISRLSIYVEKLKLGMPDDGMDLKLPIKELENLRNSLDVYQSELKEAYLNLDSKNEELWNLAHNDPLTLVANRRAFDNDWRSLISLAVGKRIDIAFMLIDCDHFKAINDTYGHDVGDKLITDLAQVLQSSLREGDKLYRLGGDEFATILWNTDDEIAEKVACRCINNIINHDFSDTGVKEHVTVSIGIAYHDVNSEDSINNLPRQADIAMYHAKKAGNRNVVHYDASLEKATAPLVSNRIIDAVKQAINSSEGIVMHYQPIMNAKHGGVDYYEALLRIEDKQGIIGAGEIFSVVGRLSLDAEMDVAIIQQVAKDLENKKLPINTGVSINLSSASLMLPNLADYLMPVIENAHNYRCIVEVTENTLISNIKSACTKLAELKSIGFKVALDDFGNGYSSIRYLASMPIDIVKFDVSMIRQMMIEDKSRHIIIGTAGVILDAGYSLVAEGIENDDMRDTVIAMGATHLQGFALGRPQPVEKLNS